MRRSEFVKTRWDLNLKSGAQTPHTTYYNAARISPPPNKEWFLMTFFGFLVLGLYFLGKIVRKKPPNQ